MSFTRFDQYRFRRELKRRRALGAVLFFGIDDVDLTRSLRGKIDRAFVVDDCGDNPSGEGLGSSFSRCSFQSSNVMIARPPTDSGCSGKRG